MSGKIVITNKKIVDYYATNKHIDIETVNILMIDLLEASNASNMNNPSVLKEFMKTFQDQGKEIIKTVQEQTKETIKTVQEHGKELLNTTEKSSKLLINSTTTTNTELSKVLNSLILLNESSKTEFSSIKSLYNHTNDTLKKEMETIKLLLTNMSNSLINKMYEIKDNYLVEIKQILKSSDTEIKQLLKLSETDIKDILRLSNNELKEFINNSNIDIKQLFKLSENEIKDIYKLSDTEIKQLIKLSESQTILSVKTLIDNQNDNLFNNLKQILPTDLTLLCNNIITDFRNDINNGFDKLSLNKISMDTLTLLIDNKYNNIISNIQNNLTSLINSTEERLTKNINTLKDENIKNIINQENVNNELLQYLNKYNKSSTKGEISETRLYNLITELYPSADIKNTTKENSNGDIIIKRIDKPTILIENKNYNTIIKKDEVDKFLRDITNNKSNGIFISQKTGIVGKENFQIDIHNNSILVYIHNCDYDKYKIDLAVKIIDILSQKLTYMEDADIKINKELLEKINYEYTTFNNKKDELSNTIKEFYKKSMEQHKELSLPSLELYLSDYFANSKKNILTCDICKIYQESNLMSLSRHKTACLKKYKKKLDNNSIRDK
jgi:hypothetical protein